MKALYPFITVTLLLSAAFSISLSAQPCLSFSLLDQQVLDSAHKNAPFGGISAIESIPADVFAGGDSKESFFLFSDHTDAGHKPAKDWGVTTAPRTYYFGLIDRKSVSGGRQFFELNDVECVRYNKQLNTLFYSFETDYETGIGMYKPADKQAQPMLLHTQHFAVKNRGIEGIAIMSDSSLWYALESGEAGSTYVTSFVRIPFKYGRHRTADRQIYQYPFDKCSCLSDEQCKRYDGSIGSGVSEILELPEKLGGGLLVLERCWNDTANSVRLYIARVDGKSRLLTKELAFDFNKDFQPDNLEGMAWGPDDGGYPTLYVVSDDNYNWTPSKPKTPQKTQLIRLRVRVRN